MRSRESTYRIKWWQDLPLIGLWALFVIAIVAMVVVSSIRQLSQLEVVLLQVVTLGTGLAGSYRFGRNAAREAALDVVRPHARSAVRRLLSLRDSLYRLSARIEQYKVDPDYDVRFDLVQAIIDEQLPNGRSAVEDWRDVATEDVDEIIQTWAANLDREEHDDAS